MIAKQIRHACIEHGFFYLQHHGMDAQLLQAAMDQTKALFDLPLTDKQALSDPILSRGYTAMQEETLDPQHQTEGDTKEGFYIGPEIATDNPLYNPGNYTITHGFNPSNKYINLTYECIRFCFSPPFV